METEGDDHAIVAEAFACCTMRSGHGQEREALDCRRRLAGEGTSEDGLFDGLLAGVLAGMLAGAIRGLYAGAMDGLYAGAISGLLELSATLA